MAEAKKNSANISDRALEMIMRDVLNSVEECLLDSAYGGSKGGFEIIDIHTPQKEKAANTRDNTSEEGGSAEVISFPTKHIVYC